MEAMFNLLFRFWPRKSVGTPNASAPAAREVVLMKSRRLTRGNETSSGDLNWSNLFDRFHMRTSIHLPEGFIGKPLACETEAGLVAPCCCIG
jgi:hypothetical protein